MLDKVLEAIDAVVQNIYIIDQDHLIDSYVTLLDELMNFINFMSENGYTINLDEEAKAMQQAFEKKDYIELADLLLYTIKPEFVNLQIEFGK